MDIYDLKTMGHSGFEQCRVVDVNAYNAGEGQPDALFEGDVDDAPDCLDDLEITSIDIWYDEDARRIEVTIDVDGCNEKTMEELHAWRDEQANEDDEFEDYPAGRDEPPSATDDESDGRPADGSEPQLAASDF